MFPGQLELKETTEDFIRMDCTNINHMEIKKALKGLIYCLSILYVQHTPPPHTHIPDLMYLLLFKNEMLCDGGPRQLLRSIMCL